MSKSKRINKEYDYIFKLVLIGDSTVGKSSLLVRYADEQFSGNYIATIGVDFRFKTIKLDNKNIKLQIWDTAGQERFKTITGSYYKGADGIIIGYDIGDQKTFKSIDEFWLKQIQEHGEKEVELMIIGNKADLDNRQVQDEEAELFSQKRDILFFETSAKTGDNVESAFNALTSKILLKRLQQIKVRKEERRKKKEGGNNTSQLDDSIDSSQDDDNNKYKLSKEKQLNQDEQIKKLNHCQC